jgi:hypothetical protein
MRASYLVKDGASNESLYHYPDGGLSYGTNSEKFQIVSLHVNDGIGLYVYDGKIAYVVKVDIIDGGATICELSTRQFLSSNPRKKDLAGGVNFNREKPSAWETFKLEETSHTPAWVNFYLEAIESRSLDLVFQRITAGENIDIPFLAFILHNHSHGNLDNAVRFRATQESFLHGVLKLARGNYLITPLLTELLQGRNKLSPRVLGTDRDIYGRGVDVRNPWSILNASFRRTMKKHGRACIVATARNEGVYLIEWIAYHLQLGFEKIFLYTNNNQDGSLELLKALHSSDYITLIESDVGSGGNAQVKAYTHALMANAEVNQYEWCAFIDVDEFISFDQFKFKDFSDFLCWAGATGADVIALSWILASNDTRGKSWLDRPVTERIVTHSPFQSNLIKCIVRPESAIISGPHYPLSTNGCALSVVNAERNRFNFERLENPFDITRPASPTFKNAHLYHFELKSLPELIWKYSRNRGNYSAIMEDIQFNDHFMDRIGHFRKCIDDGHTHRINLSVTSNDLRMKIASILSDESVRLRFDEVRDLTAKRYLKLLDYLPCYLKTQVTEERLYAARDWLVSNLPSEVETP